MLFELVSRLRALDVRLWVDGEDLRFNAPAGALTPDLRAQLRAHKQELIGFLRDGTAVDARPPITSVPRTRELPLSFAQERLWFLDRLHPGSAAYVISGAIRLRGTLDRSALARSVSEIVRRHEALRTTFAEAHGRPFARLEPAAPVHLPCLELAHVPAGEREAEALGHVRREALVPFDLEKGPLLRGTLLALEPDEHWLVLAVHHIVFDGWSFGLLLGELGQLYPAFASGHPSPLADLNVHYTDFVHWQKSHLTDEMLAGQLAYWRQHLGRSSDAPNLPTSRPRPPVQTDRGEAMTASFPREASLALDALAREEGATRFMALLATFHAFLYELNGQTDPRVGSPIANRPRAETEAMIGLFVNTLIFRGDLSGDPSFREVLRRTRRMALDAYANQDVPFEKLVHALEPVRSASHTPLFQVTFSFHPEPQTSLEMPGLVMSPIDADATSGKFDFGLALVDTPEGVQGRWLYNADVFDRSTIEAWNERYRDLLERMVAEPERALSMLVSARPETRPLHTRTNLRWPQLLAWLIQRLHPEWSSYVMPTTFTLEGHIDVERFREAFAIAIRDIEALRSVVDEVDGVPMVRVVSKLPFFVEHVDLSRTPDPHAAFAEWISVRRLAPVVLDRCTFDSALVTLSEQKFVWCLRQHQMFTDATSTTLTYKYVETVYRALTEARPLPAPPPSFEAYVDDERARTARPLLPNHERRDPLAFYGKVAPGPLAKVRRTTFVLGGERSQKLRARAAQLPLFAKSPDGAILDVFVAIIAAYVHRVTGATEVSFGISVHNRRGERFRETIGMLMDTLAVPIATEASQTCRALLGGVERTLAETLRRHAEGKTPLDYQVALDVALNFVNQRITHLPPFAGTTSARQFYQPMGHQCEPLYINLWSPESDAPGTEGRAEDGYLIHFDAREDVLDEHQMRWVKEHFLRVTDAFLNDFDLPLGKIAMRGDDERLFVSETSRGPNRPLPEDTFPRLFELRARSSPDREAVRCGAQSLTYFELDARANELAHRLRARGIGVDDVVGLCIRRSPEMIVGVLGILRAGAAYLPLDPEYPAERLRFMIEDSAIGVIVTEKHLAGDLANHGPVLLAIDATPDEGDEVTSAPPCHPAPHHLAYVIYTSGSTGTPKGVLVTHQGLLNHNLATIELCNLGPDDRVLQFHSIVFDAAAEEIFPTLLAGATLVLSPYPSMTPCSELDELLERERISFASLPTAYWHEWVRELERTNARPARSLRTLVVGGEAARSRHLATWKRLGGARWINTYGPTEATIVTTAYDDGTCPVPASSAGMQGVPIGRPYPNTRAYVLDEELQPVPLGMTGELCIGGAGLARGYLNRADRTSERFVPDPFDGAPGARMYRTGDRVRLRGDGQLEYVGRVDDQIKLRGFRIELGEVEATLRSHADVHDAAVVVWEAKNGDKRLVAHVVPRAGTAPAARTLRTFLESKLPPYMVPATCTIAEALPLTRTGKVDRRALEALSPADAEERREFVAPRSGMEIRLRAIWEAVLEHGPIGVTDNFFELGGHSLLVARLVAVLREELGTAIPLTAVFECPTIEALSERIQRGDSGASHSPMIPIRPRGRKPPLFCVAPGSGLVLGYLALGHALDREQPLYAFEPPGLHEASSALTSIEEMAALYVRTLRLARPEGPYMIGGWSVGGVVAFEMAQQLRSAGEEVGLLVLFDTMAPAPGIVTELRPEDPEGMLASLKEEGVFPSDFSPEQSKRMFEVFTTSAQALERYQPAKYPGSVVLLRAQERLDERAEESVFRDRALGWSDWVSGRLEIIDVPGNHFNIFKPEHVSTLAHRLTDCLRAAALAVDEAGQRNERGGLVNALQGQLDPENPANLLDEPRRE